MGVGGWGEMTTPFRVLFLDALQIRVTLTTRVDADASACHLTSILSSKERRKNEIERISFSGNPEHLL
jgi:hypothetical protein